MYVYAGILIAGLLGGFTSGWLVQGWRHDSIDHQKQIALSRDIVKRQDRVDEASISHEDFKAKEEIRYVDRIKYVKTFIDRPVYRNQCFDDDGVRSINSAIRGEDSSQPKTAVPTTAKP